jgi:hypothetical protein
MLRQLSERHGVREQTAEQPNNGHIVDGQRANLAWTD